MKSKNSLTLKKAWGAIVATVLAFMTITTGVATAAEDTAADTGTCGQKIALVIDTSYSMYGNEQYVIDATDAVVDALNGTHSAVGFYTTGNLDDSPTKLVGADGQPFSTRTQADVDKLKNAFTTWFTPDGFGDSDIGPGLKEIADGEYEQIYFITDGELWSASEDTEAARVKNAGAVLTLLIVDKDLDTVHDDVNALATSPSHIYTATSYEELTAPLKTVVTSGCQATINITKHMAGDNEVAVSGWEFMIGERKGTTDDTGYVSLNTGVTSAEKQSVTVTENAPGYEFAAVDCRITDGDTIDSLIAGTTFTVELSVDDIVVCDVTNAVLPTPGPGDNTTPPADPTPTEEPTPSGEPTPSN
ncbi:MAG: vWA domain-containing protein [Actinomycetaceae bacterium]|nr:vWA domain-containing protein [Actinomycetaceae bacterium]